MSSLKQCVSTLCNCTSLFFKPITATKNIQTYDIEMS